METKNQKYELEKRAMKYHRIFLWTKWLLLIVAISAFIKFTLIPYFIGQLCSTLLLVGSVLLERSENTILGAFLKKDLLSCVEAELQEYTLRKSNPQGEYIPFCLPTKSEIIDQLRNISFQSKILTNLWKQILPNNGGDLDWEIFDQKYGILSRVSIHISEKKVISGVFDISFADLLSLKYIDPVNIISEAYIRYLSIEDLVELLKDKSELFMLNFISKRDPEIGTLDDLIEDIHAAQKTIRISLEDAWNLNTCKPRSIALAYSWSHSTWGDTYQARNTKGALFAKMLNYPGVSVVDFQYWPSLSHKQVIGIKRKLPEICDEIFLKKGLLSELTDTFLIHEYSILRINLFNAVTVLSRIDSTQIRDFLRAESEVRNRFPLPTI